MASSQALAYLARTVGGNEGGNAANITTLIDGLVSDGVWSKLDCLYVLAQQNATDALLNLIGTNYTISGTGTFVAYKGFTSLTSLLNTQFNASTATGPNFIQNSSSLGVWIYASLAETIPEINNIPVTGTGADSMIYDDYTDGNFYARVNDSGSSGVPIPGSKGLFVGDRSSSNAVVPYWNGTAQTLQSGTSSPPTNGVFYIGGALVSGNPVVSGSTICAAFIGASLGAAGPARPLQPPSSTHMDGGECRAPADRLGLVRQRRRRQRHDAEQRRADGDRIRWR